MHTLLLWSLLGCFGGGGGELPTATVTRGPFEVTLAIPGELKAVRSVSLSAPDLPGQTKVTWVIDEGSRVQAGDVLVRFDETELKNTLEQAENDLEVALTKIDQRRAQLAVRLGDLQNDVTRAELGLKRAEMRLTDSETVPRVEREAARIDVEESSISVERSRAALESAKLEGQAELELLRLDADRARRTLDKVRNLLDKAVMTAPSPGIVILTPIWKGGSRGPVSAGDTVWGGSSLIELPDLAEMEVEAWVHEVDAAKVLAGQPVSVVIDAHPRPAHGGQVTRVADLAVQRDREKAVKFLKVMISLDDTTEVMKPGMTVRAEVQVDRREDVLSVPQEAIFYEGQQPVVYRKGFAGFAATPVQLDISNDTHVVVEGLSEGDVVALVHPESAARGEPPSPGVPSGPAAAATP